MHEAPLAPDAERRLDSFCGKFGGTYALRASTREIGETHDKLAAQSVPYALAWRGSDAPSHLTLAISERRPAPAKARMSRSVRLVARP
jgi:hypothetical protein